MYLHERTYGKVTYSKKYTFLFFACNTGIICGVVGLFLPETLGLGTSFIRDLIENPINLNYVIFFLIGKTFLTIICIRLNLFGVYFLLLYF